MGNMRLCDTCSAEIPPDAPEGLCPSCLLRFGAHDFGATSNEPSSVTRMTFTFGRDAQIGRVMGDYELLEILGRGAMGVVYRAKQLSLDRGVAVKVLPENLDYDGAFRKRFFREGRALGRLNHPNIVSVYNVGKDRETHYIVMELVRGRTLAQLIAETGTIPVSRAINATRQIASALAEAHYQGIIHRDIKPSNIMVSNKGQLKVMDFGIARVFFDTATPTTGAGAVGTPAYMAPEQWRSQPPSPQGDFYSLGVLLYEMLTGSVPFKAKTPHEMMLQVLECEFPAPSMFNPAIPSALDQIVLKMVAKDPSDRYSSVKELDKDLREFAQPDHALRGDAIDLQFEKLIRRELSISSGHEKRDTLSEPDEVAIKAPPYRGFRGLPREEIRLTIVIPPFLVKHFTLIGLSILAIEALIIGILVFILL